MQELRCPRQGGPEWRRYESPHFDVTSDLSPPRARRLVGKMERTYRSFLDVTGWRFPGRGEPPGHMRIVVFSRRADYEAVAPPRTDGFFRPGALEEDAAVIIDNDGGHPPGEIFLHELTHRLIRYYVPNLPLALNEGLAEFFSTFHVTADGVAHNGAPPRRIEMIVGRSVPLPSLGALVRQETLEGLSPQQVFCFYAASWFLADSLAETGMLPDLLGRMADGASFATAFTDLYGDAGWRHLEQTYLVQTRLAYNGTSAFRGFDKAYVLPPFADTVDNELPLDDGALHLLWADLQIGRHDVARQVTLAAEHGSESAELSYLRGLVAALQNDAAKADHELALAVAARPSEERYHLMLARARATQIFEPGAQATLAPEVEWLAAHGQSAQGMALVAIYAALRGDVAEALRQVQRGLERDPTSAQVYLALAVAKASAGDLDGAFEAAQRSWRLTPTEAAGDPTAKNLMLRLQHMRRPFELKLPAAKKGPSLFR
jgi:tetratricopeptide (TPR) repeat protein